MSRILALDFGRAHTGAAISDPTGSIVRPLEDITDAVTPDGINKIVSMVDKEGVGTVVVGMPVSLTGTMGGQAHETNEFISALKARLPVPVKTWDERFTSKIARAKCRFSSASPHSLAACVILEDFLSSEEFRQG